MATPKPKRDRRPVGASSLPPGSIVSYTAAAPGVGGNPTITFAEAMVMHDFSAFVEQANGESAQSWTIVDNRTVVLEFADPVDPGDILNWSPNNAGARSITGAYIDPSDVGVYAMSAASEQGEEPAPESDKRADEAAQAPDAAPRPPGPKKRVRSHKRH